MDQVLIDQIVTLARELLAEPAVSVQIAECHGRTLVIQVDGGAKPAPDPRWRHGVTLPPVSPGKEP
jgi:hypothetical protein